MDPLAHTLVGATLAETGLKHTTRLGAATLILGANFPDVDAVMMLVGHDAALLHRRGWTHGILAMLVLPFVLTGFMLLVDRVLRRGRRGHVEDQPPPPARFAPLLGLSCLSVWSHPFFDWLNEYGVRVLMPFDGAWFYGDALFIVDPWLWLMAGCAVVLAHSRSRLAAMAWLVLLLATSALVTGSSRSPAEAKIIWCFGAGLIIFLRLRNRPPNIARTAIICTATMVVYISAMLFGTMRARERAESWLHAQDMIPTMMAATPVATRPFQREIIALVDGTYLFLTVPWLGNDTVKYAYHPIAMGPRDRVVNAALAAPSVQGMSNWLRFPAFQTEKLPQGYRVTIQDVRYSRSQARIGIAVVELDESLQERPVLNRSGKPGAIQGP